MRNGLRKSFTRTRSEPKEDGARSWHVADESKFSLRVDMSWLGRRGGHHIFIWRFGSGRKHDDVPPIFAFADLAAAPLCHSAARLPLATSTLRHAQPTLCHACVLGFPAVVSRVSAAASCRVIAAAGEPLISTEARRAPPAQVPGRRRTPGKGPPRRPRASLDWYPRVSWWP